ncbi:unnamed protein product [Medioppia subpectinata]|uniref:Uncharacterized protein n=1 Tax=Medioppia subpectinata TaxID=1979941 RepID=A0A7R9PUU1_9ACAR|nr:unnamed protein product [Medioppia subpectinata]CAG2101949.1 unnamed protein product [Medioppia subpectinata]
MAKPNKLLTDWKIYNKTSPDIENDFKGTSDAVIPVTNTTGFDKTLPNFGIQVMPVKNVYKRDYNCYDIGKVRHVFLNRPTDAIPADGQSGHKVIAVFNDYNSSFKRLLWLYADELEIRYCWTQTDAMSTDCFPNSTTLIDCGFKPPTSTSTVTTETVAKPITTSSPVLTSLTSSLVLNPNPTLNPSPGINYLVVGNVAAFMTLVVVFIASAVTRSNTDTHTLNPWRAITTVDCRALMVTNLYVASSLYVRLASRHTVAHQGEEKGGVNQNDRNVDRHVLVAKREHKNDQGDHRRTGHPHNAQKSRPIVTVDTHNLQRTGDPIGVGAGHRTSGADTLAQVVVDRFLFAHHIIGHIRNMKYEPMKKCIVWRRPRLRKSIDLNTRRVRPSRSRTRRSLVSPIDAGVITPDIMVELHVHEVAVVADQQVESVAPIPVDAHARCAPDDSIRILSGIGSWRLSSGSLGLSGSGLLAGDSFAKRWYYPISIFRILFKTIRDIQTFSIENQILKGMCERKYSQHFVRTLSFGNH